MKIGLKKLEYLPLESVQDFSFMPRGSKVVLKAFTSELPRLLEGTQESAELSEAWPAGAKGIYSKVQVSISVRQNTSQSRALLDAMVGRRCLFRLTLVDGRAYVIGSREFPPTMTYTSRVSGTSMQEYAVSIACDSVHGMLEDISESL